MVWRFVGLVLAVAGLMFAQGPRGNGSAFAGGPSLRAGAPLDMTQTFVIEGVIESVSIAPGVQYPSVVVDGKEIRIAPVWFLLDNDFELAAGDKVKILAAACACAETAWYAVEITRGNTTLVLGDSLGIPLWTRALGAVDGSGASWPATALRGGACLDLATLETVSGVVASLNAGAGIQQPTLILKTEDGRLLSIRLVPERVLFEQDVELAAGATLKVKIAKSACADALVALELTTADGVVIRLRDESGRPAWPR